MGYRLRHVGTVKPDQPLSIIQFLKVVHLAQSDMYQKALDEYNSCKEVAHTWDEFMAALNRRHMILAPW